MIHVMTVHWKDDKWIDIQLKYLRKHLHLPFRTYAYLNDLPGDHAGKFDYASTAPILEHAVKLNLLAETACAAGRTSDDILIFIDGDAFPIADLSTYVREKLATHPLLAVQRKENNGDRQPHPCFAATTVGAWRRLRGDWTAGFKWRTSDGNEKTDVGGNLLGILESRGIDWYPLLRSNRNNPHPLLFGVYDNVVYHHGAGFRSGVSHLDQVMHGIRNVRRQILVSPRHAEHPAQKVYREILARNELLKSEMFRKICDDENFFLHLL